MTPERHPLLPAFLVAFLALTGPLCAGLKWDALTLDLHPGPADTLAEGKFGFVNSGPDAVTIESLKSSCDCAVATLEKKTYAQGERGEIVARYEIGTRFGDQSATIKVALKGQREPETLTLNIAIPEPAKITPLMLIWTAGQTPEPKTIEVEALPNQPLRVTKVTSNPPGFETRWETITEAAKYRIIVTPTHTEKTTFAVVNIQAQFQDGKKSLQAYAQVKPR